MPSIEQTSICSPHETLHHALDEYITHLEKSQDDASGWGRVKLRQAQTLKDRHADIPLSELSLAKMEEMAQYWGSRPMVKDREKPIAPISAKKYFERLKDFWRWLHRKTSYSWRRPVGHEEIKIKVQLTNTEKAAKRKTLHIDTYSLDELSILYQNSLPPTHFSVPFSRSPD